MRKQRLEIKEVSGPVENVDIQFGLHLYHTQTPKPSTQLPLAPSPTPGCRCIRVSKHSFGSLLCVTPQQQHVPGSGTSSWGRPAQGGKGDVRRSCLLRHTLAAREAESKSLLEVV